MYDDEEESDFDILRRRAALLARVEEDTSNVERLELLVFRLGQQLFAVRSQHTVEIFRAHQVTFAPLPGCGSQIVGVISIQGTLIPLVRTQLLLIDDQSEGEGSNIVVVSVGETRYGLLVDEVIGMRMLPANELFVPSGGDAAPWVRGVTADDVTVLHLLPLLTFENLGFPETAPRKVEA